MKAMILAAGRGERLRPLTDTLPKSLVEVRGQSLLERHLERLHSGGIRDVVINLGWLGEQIERRIGNGARYGLAVEYSREGENILDTGGGIHRALPLLGSEPFLVINADIFTDIPVPRVALDDADVGHLVLVGTPRYRHHGDFDLLNGRIDNGTQPEHTFSGIAIYRPAFFAACEAGRFSIVPMLRSAADDKRLSGSLHKELWADVGTPDRLLALSGDESSSDMP